MDESFRKAVRSAVERINPKLSRSCPFLDLALTMDNKLPDQEKATIVDRFVMYSKAPPAMMYVNQLLFYAGRSTATKKPKLEGKHFMTFFTPQSVDIKLAEDKIISDKVMYEDYISTRKDELVDDVLKEALLEAAKQLEEQFGSPSPSPKQLLIQSYSVEGDPQNCSEDKPGLDDQDSIDLAFTSTVEAALSEFSRLDHEKTSIQLMDLLIDAASRLEFPAKMVMGEWIVLSSLPHPEASAGSDVLNECLYQAVMKLQFKLKVEFPNKALIAAIERLPADKEVKLLLQFVIVEMIDKPQTSEQCGIVMKVKFEACIDMKMKFKVPRSIEQGEPRANVEMSLPLWRRIVNMFSKTK